MQAQGMLYFILDWCGNDLGLVEELVEYFYGDWTQHIYDESVAECLGNWLNESPVVRGYRERFAAYPTRVRRSFNFYAAEANLCCIALRSISKHQTTFDAYS